jgi:ABC-type lipoprotein export system ATPase subunit
MPGGLPLAAAGICLRAGDPAAAPIVDVARLALVAGERVALTGPSGCGKTSLLHCLAGITRPGAGVIAWGDTDIAGLSGPAGDAWRRRAVGIVFQDFHLVPELDVEANILLPVQFAGMRMPPETRARARSLAADLGLREPRRRAGLLSRGEQQRTAIARALIGRPAVILADEPTASLDRGNADALGHLLIEAASRSGATLIVATHDPGLIRRLGRAWEMRDGRLAGEEPE